MILWYVRNLLFSLKYKLGSSKPGLDFIDVPDCCSCDNMVEDCCEDCGLCPFYHPEGM